jgi:hypothetical protein
VQIYQQVELRSFRVSSADIKMRARGGLLFWFITRQMMPLSSSLALKIEKEDRNMTQDEAYAQVIHKASLLKYTEK